MTNVAATHQLLTHMARYWARHWAGRQDQAPLVDDLVSAGWIAWLMTSPPTRQKMEAQNAMQDALSLWLYGVTRGQRPRRWHPGGSLGRAQPVPDIAELALLRIGLERLWNDLRPEGRVGQPSKAQQVLRVLIESGVSWNIPKPLAQSYGVGARALYNGKRRIRDLARTLELGPVAEDRPCSRTSVARPRLRHQTPDASRQGGRHAQ